jgi:hypothetical protein
MIMSPRERQCPWCGVFCATARGSMPMTCNRCDVRFHVVPNSTHLNLKSTYNGSYDVEYIDQ